MYFQKNVTLFKITQIKVRNKLYFISIENKFNNFNNIDRITTFCTGAPLF